MAIDVELKTQKQNNTSWPLTFKASNRFPIVANRTFATLEDAQSYVDDTAADASAYPGIILSVINDSTPNNNGIYYVASVAMTEGEKGTLVKTGGSDTIVVKNYAEAIELSKTSPIGQFIKVEEDYTIDGEENAITYQKGFYIVEGEGVISALATSSGADDEVGSLRQDLISHEHNVELHIQEGERELWTNAANAINTFIEGEGIDETLDTLKEIQEWINGEGSVATELTAAIAQEATIRETKDNEIVAEIEALGVTIEDIMASMFYEGDDSEYDYKKIIEYGGDIILEEDVVLADSIVLTETKSVVELNDCTIIGGVFAESNGNIGEGNTDSYVFWAKEGSELELNGNGVVEAQKANYSMAIWAQGGTVIINGGTYINNGDGSDLIYASKGGKVYIYGGEFKPCAIQDGVSGTVQSHCALNIKDGDRDISEIKVFGGKFYNFNPANNTSEGPNTNFVAEGYVSIEVEPNVWEVIPEK